MDLSEFEVNWDRSNDMNNQVVVVQKEHDVQQTSLEKQNASFVEKVRGEQPKHIEISDLPNPVMRGNIPSIKLPKQAVERGKLYCKHCLVGRLDFKKITLPQVKSIALKLWGPEGVWKIIPLGKGFFMVRFTNEADLMRIWTGGSWKFGDQVLRLTKWTPDFDPEVQRTTKALAWVRFPKLGQQYWEYECIMSIAKGVGCPIGVDKFTLEREFGYYANVLIDLDLSKALPNQILVEVEDGEEFLQDVVYPLLPKFCPHCQLIGHSKGDCKSLQNDFGKEDTSTTRNTYKEPWRVKRSNNGTRREEVVATNKGGTSLSGTKDIATSQQVVVREAIAPTVQSPQVRSVQALVSNSQEQTTQRSDSPTAVRTPGNSLSLSNSFIALEGELDLAPETPNEEQLISEAEKLIGRWSDVEDEVTPTLEPVGMAIVDPRCDIQYTIRDPCARPRTEEGTGGSSSGQSLVLLNVGGISPSSSVRTINNDAFVIQEVAAIKARVSELQAKRQLMSKASDNSPTSKVKKKHCDSSATTTRSKTSAKIT